MRGKAQGLTVMSVVWSVGSGTCSGRRIDNNDLRRPKLQGEVVGNDVGLSASRESVERSSASRRSSLSGRLSARSTVAAATANGSEELG